MPSVLLFLSFCDFDNTTPRLCASKWLLFSYTRAAVEAEEAQELKRALSSQMIQLLFEQEQKLEGHLRDCISFTDTTSGKTSPRRSSPRVLVENHFTADGPAAGTERSNATPLRAGAVDYERGGGRGRDGGRKSPGESEDDGFEKVESWMVPPMGSNEEERQDGAAVGGKAGRAEESRRRRSDDDLLLVPFSSVS